MHILIDCWDCDPEIDLVASLEDALRDYQDYSPRIQQHPTLAAAWVDIFAPEQGFKQDEVVRLVAQATHAHTIEYAVIDRGASVKRPEDREHGAWGIENAERLAAPWFKTGWREPELPPEDA